MAIETAVPAALTPPAPDADAELVRRIAAGNREAHRALYDRFGREILVFLVGRLGDRPAAEELLQEIMLDVWRHSARRFRGESRVRTWLLAIAHHRACNEIRRRNREAVVEDPAAAPGAPDSAPGARDPGESGQAEAAIDLDRALEQLSADHRQALELVFFHGLSIEEAAGLLGTAPGTVKSRLSRAKARLRALLAGEVDPDV